MPKRLVPRSQVLCRRRPITLWRAWCQVEGEEAEELEIPILSEEDWNSMVGAPG